MLLRSFARPPRRRGRKMPKNAKYKIRESFPLHYPFKNDCFQAIPLLSAILPFFCAAPPPPPPGWSVLSNGRPPPPPPLSSHASSLQLPVPPSDLSKKEITISREFPPSLSLQKRLFSGNPLAFGYSAVFLCRPAPPSSWLVRALQRPASTASTPELPRFFSAAAGAAIRPEQEGNNRKDAHATKKRQLQKQRKTHTDKAPAEQNWVLDPKKRLRKSWNQNVAERHMNAWPWRPWKTCKTDAQEATAVSVDVSCWNMRLASVTLTCFCLRYGFSHLQQERPVCAGLVRDRAFAAQSIPGQVEGRRNQQLGSQLHAEYACVQLRGPWHLYLGTRPRGPLRMEP